MEVLIVYQTVSKEDIADRLIHLRNLYRQRRPSNDRERIAHEKREAITKNLLDNLFRTREHPTLRTVLDVAEIFSLTLDGAHRLFGYDLDAIRHFDIYLNGGRTHIIDAYPYNRDFLIDLPLRLGSVEAFRSKTALPDLVPEWQTDLPIRVMEDPVWTRPGAFYVHVGTKDSLGSSLPPGCTALVEPITRPEEQRPDPRSIYLLQFGNGYRCSRCVVTGKKLFLISEHRMMGQREFSYPGAVRIAGRVRVFSLALPLPEYPDLGPLPSSPRPAPLVLPWEHTSWDRLFRAKHHRFVRPRQEKSFIQHVLQSVFHRQLTERTERRYRRPSSSQPHIDTLIQMVLSNSTRYSDALHAGRMLPSDCGRLSLETLLRSNALDEVAGTRRRGRHPEPAESWHALRDRYAEWPTPLSMTFPNLQSLADRIVRLPDGADVKGLSPQLSPGSVLFLDKPSLISDRSFYEPAGREGWGRRLYAFQKGTHIICGFLRTAHGRYELFGSDQGRTAISLLSDDLSHLYRVSGAAVPV